MAKSTKLTKIKDSDCLNCGFPFSGQENFCPECGQKNKGSKLTFGSFIKEIFNGFISWDAKFWRTIIPLTINPGKVSKDYIEGKRMRYANPFRFYLTVSIVFFLILGITENYNKFNDLRSGETSNKITGKNFTFNENGIETLTTEVDLDSIQETILKEIDRAKNKQDSILSLKKTDSLPSGIKDSLNTGDNFNLSFVGNEIEVNKLIRFQKKHPKIKPDAALDSLKMTKNFSNRFWYSRAELINSFIKSKKARKELGKQILSYSSVALFILLPLFTLFIRFIYIRKKLTYVEHLVFVFHIQTVFFLLLSIFYIIGFIKDDDEILPISLVLFLIYLFIAMKKFYAQGYFKTIIKFTLSNIIFFILSSFGGIAIAFLAFALY